MSDQQTDNNGNGYTLITIRGKLEPRVFGRTTKSEHWGVYIVTPAAAYLIRPLNSNPFMHNPLEPLCGKTIEAEGHIHDYIFFAKRWKVVE
ncbi:hypothetical protein GA0116948_11770 [Chitinophaga costaii]|uniref:Uncharacterized protein n=2 Tax=Chitinophaga costaii TaxID=1335309 RepID=A0A1C4FVL5_9BACT|nr:hypothetical protein DCM91_08570 [Chitinophaga costaii]SCC59960.1 hypothetical protein GA0116948_11770 [Chitinophaga costaii]